ncbi:hypothetical protein LBMAG57_26350 [Verrucomicrobiota bacterium]|nr:hypothetical protein LBMAG57_26350 [Verrucomicrobiota bacterium]
MLRSLLFLAVMTSALSAAEALKPTLRSQPKQPDGTFAALIVCDMWDDHWCKSTARRVTEMAGPMNDMLKIARAKGVFFIHAPSSVTDFYKETPARKLAQSAPFATTPMPRATTERWGTTGTDFMVGRVEKFWCPSFSSTEITGRTPFLFAEDRRAK